MLTNGLTGYTNFDSKDWNGYMAFVKTPIYFLKNAYKCCLWHGFSQRMADNKREKLKTIHDLQYLLHDLIDESILAVLTS